MLPAYKRDIKHGSKFTDSGTGSLEIRIKETDAERPRRVVAALGVPLAWIRGTLETLPNLIKLLMSTKVPAHKRVFTVVWGSVIENGHELGKMKESCTIRSTNTTMQVTCRPRMGRNKNPFPRALIEVEDLQLLPSGPYLHQAVTLKHQLFLRTAEWVQSLIDFF